MVFLTNGDGFRRGAEKFYGCLPRAATFHAYGRQRQEEARRALAVLGLAPASEALFLGFPDRGLLAIWWDFWDPSHPYTSPYTHLDHGAGGLVYAGQPLLAKLTALLLDFRPTRVYLPHPADFHPDHEATSAFVTAALAGAEGRGLKPPRVEYYLVHEQEWHMGRPRPSSPLRPPRRLAASTDRWESLLLPAAAVRAKGRTVQAYSSQT